MKKILIILGLILIVLTMLILIFGDVRFYKKAVKTNFHDSLFFSEYYDSDKLLLVNVWSTTCAPCIAEVPDLEKINISENVKFVTIATDEDTIKLKKFLTKSVFFNTKDITLKNYFSRDSILSAIELPGVTNSFGGLSLTTKIIPYTVLIKNKKILYKNSGDGVDIDSLNKLISKNK